MRRYIVLDTFILSLLLSQPVHAQQGVAQAMQVMQAIPSAPEVRQIVLPPNAEVVLTPNDTVSSKSVKVGDKVRLSTKFDVMQEGYIVIPRGTVGEATIAYRTGKGAFGKSAKMEIEFNSLDLNGRRVPLAGKFRQEGEGNTGAAVGAVVAVGPLGAFVTGHSATLTNGQELRAHTVEPLTFNVPASVAPAPMAVVAAPRPVAQVALPVAATPAQVPPAQMSQSQPAPTTADHQ